ncbi:TioE family transcriptional regulator [Streptomyces qinglanensis]|uniref:TioE family transcriptional regulator n=1 Tax=Streptomyces qinglanensis TaxID=943816 RepID=UPI0037A39363
MGRNLQSAERLRPVDLARGHGLSTQAVRNYEADGILPPAERTDHGYRTYTPLHARALRAFLALLPGHGHRAAASIMRAVNEDAVEEALRLVDESHVQLLDDRRTLQAVESALRDLRSAGSGRSSGSGRSAGSAGATGEAGAPVSAGSGPTGPAPASGADRPGADRPGADRPGAGSAGAAGARGMFIGPLAEELGIRPATLRKWEAAGLVGPRRDPLTGYRVYDEAAVRDARLTHQLRRGGYLLEQIAPLIAQVRAAGGPEPLEDALRDWHGRLATRARALLSGAAELDSYLGERERRG